MGHSYFLHRDQRRHLVRRSPFHRTSQSSIDVAALFDQRRSSRPSNVRPVAEELSLRLSGLFMG